MHVIVYVQRCEFVLRSYKYYDGISLKIIYTCPNDLYNIKNLIYNDLKKNKINKVTFLVPKAFRIYGELLNITIKEIKRLNKNVQIYIKYVY